MATGSSSLQVTPKEQQVGALRFSICSWSVEEASCGFQTSMILWQKPQMADRAGSQPVRYVPQASDSRAFIHHCLLPTCFHKGHSLLHPFLCRSLSCRHVALRQFSSLFKRQRPRSTFQGNRNSLRLVHFTGQRTLQELLLYLCNVGRRD